jgi:hypothetical protein
MSTPAIETARPARRWGLVAAFCILAAGALWFIQQAARQLIEPVLQLRRVRRGTWR